MDEQHLITVNILSYNRRYELRNTLTKVFEQNYKKIEVIVVDNASSDGSPVMIKEEFPSVKLIQLKKNIGIAGWNEGFEAAEGEFILTLDDDSYPEKDSIHKAVGCIMKDDKIGVVCLKVYNKSEERIETDHIDKSKPNTFIGCGALIRKSIINEIGGFSSLLFLYEHETEFSMRVYNAGYKLKFCDEALVIHECSSSHRKIENQSDTRRKFFLCRNYTIIILLHFNWSGVMIFLPQLIFARLLMSLVEGNLITTLKGFISGVILLPEILLSRMPLKKKVQQFYRNGNYMGRFVREKRYSSSIN